MTEHAHDFIADDEPDLAQLLDMFDNAIEAAEPQTAAFQATPAERLSVPQMDANPSIVVHDKLEHHRDAITRGVQSMHVSPDQVLADIAAGRAHLWPGERSVIVTYVDELLDGTRVFCVRVAEGDREEILAMIPGLKAVARAMGCTKGRSEGRCGWKKALQATGWREASITMECDL